MFARALLLLVWGGIMSACGGGDSSGAGGDFAGIAGTYAATLRVSIVDGETVIRDLTITVREDGVVILNFIETVFTGTADDQKIAVIETTVDRLLASLACTIGIVKITLFVGTSTSNTISGALSSEGIVICGGESVVVVGTIAVSGSVE